MCEQARFRLRLRVARQQDRGPAEVDAQDDRVVVDVRRRAGDKRQFGFEDLDVRRTPEIKRLTSPRDAIAHMALTHDIERALIRRAAVELRRVIQDADVLACEDDREATGMISMWMREHDGIEMEHPMA